MAVIGVLVIIGAAFLLLDRSSGSQLTAPSIPAKSIAVSLSPTPSFTLVDLLAYTDSSLPITWGKETLGQTMYNNPDYSVSTISGEQQTGTLTQNAFMLRNLLSNASYLQANGWQQDIYTQADGPDGSQWGYIKRMNNKKQVVIFSYRNLSFVPPPNQTTCPCKFSVKVFLSKPF